MIKYREGNTEIKIFKQFEFQSKLQRMSVICVDQDQKYFRVYMKGDPSMIAKFCIPSSLPSNYMTEIQSYQSKGYRVLCYCTKALNTEKISDLKDALNLTRV